MIGYGSNRMRIARVEPEHALAWRSEDGNWVWSFVLLDKDGLRRLISRNRFRLPTLAAHIGIVPIEPASLVMERKMLLGIKQRAERLAASTMDAPREVRWHTEGMTEHDKFTSDQARTIGEAIGIDWRTSRFDVEQFRIGLEVELEHGRHDPATNVTDDDELVTGKIARAHLNEFPDYYTRLAAMEAEAERYWSERSGD
ncbi:MAG: DUF5661 family protein [Solirubrobacteraceae bacterium]